MIRTMLVIAVLAALPGCATLTPVQVGLAATDCAALRNAIAAAQPAIVLAPPADQATLIASAAKVDADCVNIQTPAQVTQVFVDIALAKRQLAAIKAGASPPAQ